MMQISKKSSISGKGKRTAAVLAIAGLLANTLPGESQAAMRAAPLSAAGTASGLAPLAGLAAGGLGAGNALTGKSPISIGLTVGRSALPGVAQVSITPALSPAAAIERIGPASIRGLKAAPREIVPSARKLSPSAASRRMGVLFDGSKGIPGSVVAETIAGSEDLADASAKLSRLGKLSSPSEGPGFEFALRRAWSEASGEIADPVSVDASWPVPALVVRRGGTVYFVHGIAHGQVFPAAKGPVRRLVADLKARGLALYSEKNLPKGYQYDHGFEIDDSGGSVRVRPPAEVQPGLPAAVTVIHAALAAAAVALPAALVVQDPGSLVAWTVLGAAGAVIAAARRGFLPVLALRHRYWALRARLSGNADLAHHFTKEARALFTPLPDLEGLRGVELPMPLAASTGSRRSRRSRMIAEAVPGPVAGKPAEVHILAGVNHAREIAWFLGRR